MSQEKKKRSLCLVDLCKNEVINLIKLWLPTNRGCFFLLKLIESNDGAVASALKKKIKPHVNILKQQASEGAKHLLQAVQKK